MQRHKPFLLQTGVLDFGIAKNLPELICNHEDAWITQQRISSLLTWEDPCLAAHQASD